MPTQPPGRALKMTGAKARKARKLRAGGHSYARIGAELGVSGRTVERTLATAASLPPPAGVTPAARAPELSDGASLLEKVRLLYQAVQAARESLPADSDVAARLAVDAVDVGAVVARLEARAQLGVVRMSRDQIDDAQRSLVAKLNAAIQGARDAGKLHCAGCDVPLEIAPMPTPAPVWRPHPTARREPSASDQALAASLDKYFASLRALAAGSADAPSSAKIPEAGGAARVAPGPGYKARRRSGDIRSGHHRAR